MHQFSQKQKFLINQNFDSFSFYKYLMFESKFFQFFTINSDEILLKNQSILNSNLNVSFRNENHFIISFAVTIIENKNFVFKSFLSSNLISSFQNKNYFSQSIRIIRSINQKSIDYFSNYVAIFNSNLHENSLFFFSFNKKNDEDFRFSNIKKIVDDEFIDFAIKSEFENNNYVEFNSNVNSSTNFDLKKIILKSNTIKQLKKKFMKFN